MKLKRIAYSSGEPAGIGPDIALYLALAQASQPSSAELVVLGNKQLLQDRAHQLGLDVSLVEYDASRPPQHWPLGTLLVAEHALAGTVTAGELNPANSRYVLNLLDHACRGCLQGEFDAVMTGPVHKGVINDAGIAFSGHTEFFAEQSQTPQVVMMLATPGLRVALVTTHLPLSQVPSAINQPLVESVTEIVASALKQQFACPQPRILMCGLNPHAGEQGHLGGEEIEHIEPAIRDLKQRGIDVSGPWPADTVFQPHYLENADAVIAMYHDQGLPVLKYRGFGNAVNITLGLPFVRTSVDHGTALDKAGTGAIDIGSASYALETALTMVTE
ncbi:4-hydroxythreonine-4-phosphate dehydrogenase [Pseudidiomarina piscicola]|uniref:4-hydroxythreonine-4-phosphate dehydrogenase n=1 Tax=Pseudidiomarina piscicola TaxID=2614830 RepID=A0A7D9N2N2_9GAMM|nr:4-hydroxythreonine-4-phosphate dehydrogenase PdxA [Pseudidiomarina piscicola]CAB0151645.1 4-hydroxythreonine-4-phosphate dehydrogenase [Pseudidiomarina piscicola]VZT41110.1 4-hydroxythreonine-4-phosphate dehydrogenase [Pseudomonas aeruginosa]